MVSKHNIRLNPNRNKAVHTGIAFASGDKGITLVIEVEEMDCSNTTAKIVFKRSNGTSVEADITGSNNVYTYELRGNELEIPGLVVADVKFYEDTKRISTATFTFTATSDTMDGLGAGAGGYSDRLEQLVEEAEGVVAEAEKNYNDAASTANEAKETLKATTEEAVQTEAELKEMLVQYQNKFGEVGVLNPRGTYNSATTYEKFDLVYYGGVSWLCLKSCTGVTPAEGAYWQLFASADGGNAASLGGKSASEWQTNLDNAGNRINDSVDSYDSFAALYNKGTGIYAAYILGTDRPTDSGDYYVIQKYRSATLGTQMAITHNSYDTYVRTMHDGTWQPWRKLATTADLANYLPKTGGNVYGNVNAVADDTTARQMNVMNSLRRVYQEVSTNGVWGVYDGTNGKVLIISSADGVTTTFNGTATNADFLKVRHSNEINFLGLTGLEEMFFNFRNADTNNSDVTTLKRYCFGDKSISDANYITLDMTQGSGIRNILHTGNSAKVAIREAAPTDTTALWYDTVNKMCKRYVDGAWQA